MQFNMWLERDFHILALEGRAAVKVEVSGERAFSDLTSNDFSNAHERSKLSFAQQLSDMRIPLLA